MTSTRGQAVKALLLGLCCVLAACDNPAPEPDEPRPVTSSPTTSPPLTLTTPADPSMGVAAVRWPDRLGDLSGLLDRLPPVLLDAKREVDVDDEENPVATALYGDVVYLTADLEHKTTDTASGKPEVVTAGQSLAASFNLGLACDKKTYQGTIPPLRGGLGPAFEKKSSTKTRWFSCTIAEAEGNEEYTGHAIGWTRGKGAWLVIADGGEPAARAMVGALVEAAG